MDDQAIPSAVLKVAKALVASGINLSEVDRASVQRQKPYRVAEVAAVLDVHRATVYRDIEAGRCGAYRIGEGSGALRISPEDFEKYKAAMKANAATRQNEGAA